MLILNIKLLCNVSNNFPHISVKDGVTPNIKVY